MKRQVFDLPRLLAELDPNAPLALRHLWLINTLRWVRSAQPSVEDAVARVGDFVSAVEADPAAAERLRQWWLRFVGEVDITTLLADFGFATRTAMVSEIGERLRLKLLPGTPETLNAAELFSIALNAPFDARWLAALPEELIMRLRAILVTPMLGVSPTGESEGSNLSQDDAAQASATEIAPNFWQRALLDAIAYCAGQMMASGFAPEVRLRMSDAARTQQPFHALLSDVHALRVEVIHGLRTSQRLDEAIARLRERLDACRAAIGTVYQHFGQGGISVGLVFRLRQLRTRIVRVRQLLDCLTSATPGQEAMRLLAGFVHVGRERRSLRKLMSDNSSLLAAKMTERSAETGEHYITRDGREYLQMFSRAAGGGAVMALTTLAKFGISALAFSAFWGGFWAGMNYAISFVLIQLLHFTVATKQPAMTAPAMAARLKEFQDGGPIDNFVDEVTHLVRSQVAAVLGNVLVVFPLALALTLALAHWRGAPVLDADYALHTLDALHLLGPSVLFAAFTGVLLFLSSMIAGWAENWFVLLRLDSAIRFNPRIVAVLGEHRAARWSQFWRGNISGFAANISLGLMLGLTPALGAFFGLGLEVRHVTLSSGQVGVAAASLGTQVLQLPAFWWALAMLPFNGAVNVLVSFYLAFRVAVRAHNLSGVDRASVTRAIWARLRTKPSAFFMP